MISIMTDENKKVKDIIIHFHGIIDNSFYNSFILDYGAPDIIQVIEGYESSGKWYKKDSEEEFNHRVRKVALKMKEGKFEDDPLFMIWRKKNMK